MMISMGMRLLFVCSTPLQLQLPKIVTIADSACPGAGRAPHF